MIAVCGEPGNLSLSLNGEEVGGEDVVKVARNWRSGCKKLRRSHKTADAAI